MISLGGKPLLQHTIEQFKRYGVSEFFLTLQYLPKVITDYFGDGSKFGIRMNYFIETEPLGSAGGIKIFSDALSDSFFLIYGDIFSLVDYGRMAEYFGKLDDPIGVERVGLLGYRPDIDLAELNERMKFMKIHPKPHEASVAEVKKLYSMRGIFILNKKILDYIPENGKSEVGSQLLPDVIAEGGNFYGYECDEYSKGIDTMGKYKEVQDYLAGKHV
jgi:mannose-1-phosphate guanylyltransferase/phosphomannomutase